MLSDTFVCLLVLSMRIRSRPRFPLFDLLVKMLDVCPFYIRRLFFLFFFFNISFTAASFVSTHCRCGSNKNNTTSCFDWELCSVLHALWKVKIKYGPIESIQTVYLGIANTQALYLTSLIYYYFDVIVIYGIALLPNSIRFT